MHDESSDSLRQASKDKKITDKILSDLRPRVMRELKMIPGCKAVVEEVEFHGTVKITRKFPKVIQTILDHLQMQIDDQKQRAEEAGAAKFSKVATFDAAIPKSAEARVLRQYKKIYGKINPS